MGQQNSPAKSELSWSEIISNLILWGAAFGSAFLFYQLGNFELYTAAMELQSKFNYWMILLGIPVIIVIAAAFFLSLRGNLSEGLKGQKPKDQDPKDCAKQAKKKPNIENEAVPNKQDSSAKSTGQDKNPKSNIRFVWDKIDIKSEVVHAIMFGILYLSIIYREKIPGLFSHDTQLIKKYEEKALQLYTKIFALLIYSRIVMQICESTIIQKKEKLNDKSNKDQPNDKSKKDQQANTQKYGFQFVKLSQNVIITVCVIGVIIIEVCIVEIILTKETFFQNLFLKFMQY